jgi:tRNA G18 (ribose-2'-O)-methylase SpoU
MTQLVYRASLEDRRLEPYRHLKRTNLTRWSGRFIAEGEKVVERLLASRFETESVLLSESRLDFLDTIPDGVTVLVLPPEQCAHLTGYEFHQGVLACGVRRSSPLLDEIVPSRGRVTIAVAPKMTDPDNLGALLRLAAAFGLEAVLVGPGSADPFSRRTLRVSMGAAFAVPILEVDDLFGTLDRLKVLGVQLIATVLERRAEPLMTAARPERLALLLGNEAHGLSADEVAACDRRITIPMAATADSLNVAAAAAIFLYHFTRAAENETWATENGRRREL